jgi:ribonucleotide monophosphatase NagD (HAD superfamily)
MLDGGAFVAALEYATGVDATVIGKPSASCFAAALAALDAEPELTWLVTDDLEQDVRGAQLFGMKTLLLRTGKFRPETLEHSSTVPDDVLDRSSVVPDAVLSSIANVPDWIDRSL